MQLPMQNLICAMETKTFTMWNDYRNVFRLSRTNIMYFSIFSTLESKNFNSELYFGPIVVWKPAVNTHNLNIEYNTNINKLM